VNRIASFHLIRERPRRQPLVLARLVTDRLRLRRVDGLLFWRLLGTGGGDRTASGTDLRRSALFAVWRDEAALEQFLAGHSVAQRWQRAEETWHVRLRGIGGHGRWNGCAVMDGLVGGNPDGPVVMLTRAKVRLRAWGAFAKAARRVNDTAHTAPGLITLIGVGEAPIGRLGTFSVWDSIGSAVRFASENADHQQAIARTRSGNWFAEQLFARFEPFGSTGSWAGRDPLADVQDR
jgi:hypothetical protein